MLPYRAALRRAAPTRHGLWTAVRTAATVTTSASKPQEWAASNFDWGATEWGNPQNAMAVQPPARRKKESNAMRTYTPRTPGLRHLVRPINDHLWKGRPVKSLTFPKLGYGKGGRNNYGRVTVRHRGGGHKRRIRTVDFKRMEPGKQSVERIEYDPNRSAHIALLKHMKTGKLSYILAAEGMRAGDTVESFMKGIPKDLMASMGGTIDPGVLAAKTAFRGNCLPLHMVPLGSQVYSVASKPRGKAVFCRAAGTYATVMSRGATEKQKNDVILRLQSGEVRICHKDACATIGVASNPMHQYRSLGKAGRSRWLNKRPAVRGMAMNACDHPHGGGRGKSKGNKPPQSPWGTLAKGGFKTRPRRKKNPWLIQDRERNQGKRRKTK
ncbi:translation protein SH3-like domain-containing protein [Phyllosticta capitalensis]|uniref:Translation protein SH3-like domain-containing protein n=1 Tax=Phyllosticta capitalensis TaxID=121624 RepID=A0ABR1YVE1_9PEZI